MLRGRDVDEVVELKRQGLSIRAISRMTGYDRKTISRYLAEPSSRPSYGPRLQAESKLEPFKAYLKDRLRAGVWNCTVLLRELRERNYTGGYTILKDWLHPLRSKPSRWRCNDLRPRRQAGAGGLGPSSAVCPKKAASVSFGLSR